MKNDLISVIIPVYNTEKYLEECLNSVIEQSYKNIEIIIVNDGSTDNSDEIIKKFADKDKRIKYFNNKNHGVSYTRNFAIEKSLGKYLTFVDSDDFVDNDYVKKMYQKINDCDLVICGHCNYYINNKIYLKPRSEKISIKDAKRKIMGDDSYGGFSCNKMFIADIIKKNNIKYDSTITIFEDNKFCLDYLKYCKNITTIEDSLYYYRMRKSSAVNTISESKIESINNSLSYILDNYCNEDEVLKNIVNYLLLSKLLKFKASKINEFYKKRVKELLKEKYTLKQRIRLLIIKDFSFLYYKLQEKKNKGNENFV